MNHYAVENLFGIEGLNIAWYGIIITFGMILGFMLALRRCKKTGVEPDHLYNLVLWLIPVCILCARAYYVLFEWEQYKDNLLSVFQINKGGLAIYGGILGGVAVVLIYCKVKKLSFWSLADTLIPSLVLGQAIGRWGNFVNQEAYGNLITNPDLQFFPYGVYIEELGQWHQATFFYESALNTLLLIVMLISIVFFLFIRVDNRILQLLLRLVLIPVIAGVSYEFIRLAGRSDHMLVNLFSKPGLLLQRITTREPDDSMIEVGIASVEAVFDWKPYVEEIRREMK